MTVDPTSIAAGDTIQAPTTSEWYQQYVGVVTAINGELVTFLADHAYDMYYGPGDEDYDWDLPQPLECVVQLSTVTYHWPRRMSFASAVPRPAAHSGRKRNALASARTVRGSRVPPKYFSRASPNKRSCGATSENRVIDERNLRSSGEPKISSAVFPGMASVRLTHSFSRGPSTGCVEQATASAADAVPRSGWTHRSIRVHGAQGTRATSNGSVFARLVTRTPPRRNTRPGRQRTGQDRRRRPSFTGG